MKRLIYTLLFVVVSAVALTPAVEAAFPEKPITIVVYTKPGGALDVFARKFVGIAAKHTKATFVVLNKPGAGGIVAMKDILNSKNDGYKVATVTKSNIGKFVSSESDIKLEDFSWMAMLVSDPEAIITNKNLPVSTWNQVLADAKAKNGNQLWVGPAAGGNDHIMAKKVWNIMGIKAKWVPFESGEDAMAALMGGHGQVYVGNPQDVVGRPDLKCIVISAPKRLGGAFADVPTFKELGVKGLDDEIMWRGFAAKKGMPAEARAFYYDLLEKMSRDPDWRKFIEEDGADAVFYREEQFTKIVHEDAVEFRTILKELGALK